MGRPRKFAASERISFSAPLGTRRLVRQAVARLELQQDPESESTPKSVSEFALSALEEGVRRVLGESEVARVFKKDSRA